MMDDIYSDLENFNDVNIVEELKNENKELKFKLEEYSGAMHQLQKDFDKLSVEYKKLEKNYSSLLKTARAEIERKTETIKNLNLEKDKLVINALQKGKNILQNSRNKFKHPQQNKKSIENTYSCLKEVKNIKKESAERSDNQFHGNRQPSIETVSSSPADCQFTHSENKISKTENKIPKDGCTISREGRDKSDTKDDVQEGPCVRKIMNRRKSMANFGDCEPIFSSDEDSRKSHSEQQQRDPSLAGEAVRRSERHYEQQEYVAPETFDYYQPPPSSYRNRGNRHNDFERQRNYECYDKSRRRYLSPDNHHRYGKDSSENYNQKDHRDNRRLDRSPPSDRYNRSKSRDRRHNSERENYRDSGRHSYHSSESSHLGAKNKSRFELEEPSSKRPKVDSYSRHTTEHNFNKEKERGLLERHTFIKPQELLEPSSCQSPDYINIYSNVLHQSVKEIRHTALTPLPDPRLLSDKYILESNSEKPILATVMGCNVDIIPIGNATWREDKRKSLDKSHPKEVDLVSEIYKDIDNFGKSPSLESGEIQSLDEDHYASYYSNIPDQIQENVTSSVHRGHHEKEFTSKYKIPHLKKQNVTKESSITQEQQAVSNKKLNAYVKDFKVIVEGKHLSEKCPETYSNIDNDTVNVNNKKPESVLQKLMNEKELNENVNSTKSRKYNKIVNISTIEGDLELSDETSDNMDVRKEDTSQSTQNTSQSTQDTSQKNGKNDHLTEKEEHTSSKNQTNEANKSDDKVKKSKDTRKSSHSKKEHVKEKTRDSSRKRKNNRKTNQEVTSVVKEDLSPQTKRSKEKGNKLSCNHRKNKFTDLFGDSNSLITPDDLGLPNVTPDKYVPVFENTQDAVDLSVEDISKVRESADKIKVDEKSKPISDDTTTIANSENLKSSENEHYKSNISTNLIYENTISETNTTNIVKTVIISTGIQPKDIDVAFPPSKINGNSDSKKCSLNTLKENATSTPYKLINPKETQSTIDSTMITNESINTKNVYKTDLSTNFNVDLKTIPREDKIESDIPDVRIFVRRRKKATKKIYVV